MTASLMLLTELSSAANAESYDRLPALMADLVLHRVAVISTPGSSAVTTRRLRCAGANAGLVEQILGQLVGSWPRVMEN